MKLLAGLLVMVLVLRDKALVGNLTDLFIDLSKLVILLLALLVDLGFYG